MINITKIPNTALPVDHSTLTGTDFDALGKRNVVGKKESNASQIKINVTLRYLTGRFRIGR